MLSTLFGLSVLSSAVVTGSEYRSEYRSDYRSDYGSDYSKPEWPTKRPTKSWSTYQPTEEPSWPTPQPTWETTTATPTWKKTTKKPTWRKTKNPTPSPVRWTKKPTWEKYTPSPTYNEWPTYQPSYQPQQPKIVDQAVAVLFPNEDELFPQDPSPNKPIIHRSEIRGTVTFERSIPEYKTRIYGEIMGLPKLQKFGFHVHEFGNISKNCVSTGLHYNPFNVSHGGPNSKERHVGDLGNVWSDKYGVAKFEIFDEMIQLNGDISVIGRGLVIHEDPDDLKTDPTGDSGDRLACGVIGIAEESIDYQYNQQYPLRRSLIHRPTPTPRNDHYQDSCIAFVIQPNRPREEIRYLVDGNRLMDIFINGCPRWEIRPNFNNGCAGECFTIKYVDNGQFLSNDIDIFNFNLSPRVYGDKQLWIIHEGKEYGVQFTNKATNELLCSTSLSVGSIGMEQHDTGLCDWDLNRSF